VPTSKFRVGTARRERLCPPYTPSEQPIETERIADAEDVGGRVVVEADADVEINLLGVGDAVAAAGVEEVARAAMDVVVADIFHEQEALLADLALDHEGGLGRELVDGVGGHHEIRQHAAQPPTAAQFERPWKLHVRLHARTRDRLAAGRQSGAERRGEIDFPGDRADLPFDRGSDVGEPGIGPARQGVEIGGNVGQDLEAWRDAEAQPGVGSVDDLAAVTTGDIDAVLLLQAAPRHHQAGVCDIGPIGGDLAARLRAGVGGRRGNRAGRESQKAEKCCRNEPHSQISRHQNAGRGCDSPAACEVNHTDAAAPSRARHPSRHKLALPGASAGDTSLRTHQLAEPIVALRPRLC
jgi:hypothetical protein